MRCWDCLGLVLGAILAISNPATATIINIEVTGTVDSIETAGFLLDGSVGNGTTLTGFFTYDTETPDQEPSEYNGLYYIISVSMTIGNYTFTDNPLSSEDARFLVTTVDPGYSVGSSESFFDGIIIENTVPKTYNDIIWSYTSLGIMNLSTSSNEYILSDALPDLDSFPDLSVFDVGREFGVRFYDESGYKYFRISGEVTSLNAIPEPGTVFLLGLGGLALIRRRGVLR